MNKIAGEVSSWSKDDPKVYRIHYLAKEIAEHLKVEALKDEVDFFADRISDKLDSALMYYQIIVADDFKDKNISQRRTIYEGLYSNLWAFYKGRVQRYLNEMGWNIGFMFCSEKQFERETAKFIEKNPEHINMVKFARTQRNAWQTKFGHSRNVAEHSGDYRDNTELYDNPEDAKRLFSQVCYTAETIIAYFGSWKMERQWNVIERHRNALIFEDVKRFEIEHALTTNARSKQETENETSKE
jgi:hypothetical protein